MERRKFAVFCWTFRSPDRERLTEDTPIEIACDLSLSIRAQYEGAAQKALMEGGEIERAFIFEESAHYMSPQGAEVLAKAIRWCAESDAWLILPNFESVRSFAKYTGYLYEFGASLRVIEKLPAMAHDPHGQVLAHFQKHEARRKISKGMKASVKAGAKLGFASKSPNSEQAGEKGRKTQQKQAISRGAPVVQYVVSLRENEPDLTLGALAGRLNDRIGSMPELKPPKAERWTKESLGQLLRRHQKRTEFTDPPQPS